MATDYILFVHGVKSRSKEDFKKNTTALFQPIEKTLSPRGTIVKPIRCFWGDCGEDSLNHLRGQMKKSSAWDKLWFKEFRQDQIFEFVGDAALYLSRAVGAEVVDRIYDTTAQSLSQIETGDRLHLVTHSWGTVILFDLLFAKRWISPTFQQENPEAAEKVATIRNILFGLGSNPNEGLKLGSIHTMGSPIALFNLINSNTNSSHDLTPELNQFLQNLRNETNRALPWNNYIHPGDPIAYPLEGVSQEFFTATGNDGTVLLRDLVVKTNSFGENTMGILQGNFLSILYGGSAHNSYWNIGDIPKSIAQAIQP